MLVLAGTMMVLAGLLLWAFGSKLAGFSLPGDIHVRRGNVSFHFPVVTCLVLSLVASLLLKLLVKLFGK